MHALPRTALTACVLGLLPLPAAAATAIAELHGDQDSLRFALPDFVYAAGVSGDFTQLQVVDASRRNVEFAVCAQVTTEEATLETRAIEVPAIARVGTDGAGQLQLEFSPGARHPGTAEDWVIDTRRTESAIDALSGLPPIRELRSGPNLRQWSAPRRFVQEGGTVRFDPVPSPYFRVKLEQPRPTAAERPTVQVHLRNRLEERTPHWYALPQPKAGIYRNDRRLPVIAARIEDAGGSEGWTIESRQGDWDAWKPRARIPAGEQQPRSRFSAVTDPQWRLRGEGSLQLAHPAYEMRIPRPPPAERPLRILLLDKGRFGPGLSCDHTNKLPRQAPERIEALETSLANGPGGQRDLRLYFLVLVLAGLAVGLAVRRFLRRRQAR